MSLVYATARVKSHEKQILSYDKTIRMSDAATLDDAVKILQESNYGGGVILDNPLKYDELLDAEFKSVSDFIFEIMPDGYGMDAFFIKNDYHNAKALMKVKYTGGNSENALFAPVGKLPLDEFREWIMTDTYDKCYPLMKDALIAIDKAFADGNRSPRLIDTLLEKACYKDILEHLKKIGTKAASIREYFISYIDMSNILTYFRVKRMNASYKEFENNFIEGGTLDESLFIKYFDSPAISVYEGLKFTKYASVVQKAVEEYEKGAFPMYENAMDGYLISLFKGLRSDVFSIAPIAGYYVAKQIELKSVRIILTGIKNNIDRTVIKSRLRETYA